MDWKLAVERNRVALKRILASLLAMAALTGPTMPRALHRAVTKLLRPAESAARRLIIIAAYGIEVLPPKPPRPPKPRPKATILRKGVGTGLPRDPAAIRATALGKPIRTAPHRLSLPLFDPLRLPRRWRPIQRCTPRILFPGDPSFVPAPARPLPRPDDAVSATRIAMRLSALARALDDLPAQALRFARWQADKRSSIQNRKRFAAQPGSLPVRHAFGRVSALKPGRPPGWRRKSTHQVHAVLEEIHGLALRALRPPGGTL
jgi:hypothetical protein